LKIALIEPRAAGFHVFSKFPLPRLGLPILGTILRRQGHEVKIWVQEMGELDYRAILSSDLVGVSTTTSTAPEAYAIALRVSKAGIPVVLGGPHATALPEEGLQHADFVLRGEADVTFPEFVERWPSRSALEDIPGLSFHTPEGPRHNPCAPAPPDLDLIPEPDFSLVQHAEKMVITPIYTSRGCPFDCYFCSVTRMFGRRYRFRSEEAVLAEIARRKHRCLFFYDDNFAANAKRSRSLLEKMLQRGLTPRWTAQVRADIARDRDLLKLMKRANCFALYIGLESVNPETLRMYNKRQSVEEMREHVARIHEAGIRIHGMFVLGSDADTVRTVRDTGRFARDMHIETVQFMIQTPLPGTRLFQDLTTQGRILTRDWSLYDGHHVVYRPSGMTPFELQTEVVKALGRFYSTRAYMALLLKMRFFSAALAYSGNTLVAKWKRQNRNFMARLKALPTGSMILPP
jgi:radical SAM superfamily enzyme YgiQ (UPF0313 family)